MELTKAQEEEIIKMYQDDRSVHAIAAELRVDYDEVWDFLLTVRDYFARNIWKEETKNPQSAEKLTGEQEGEIVRLYQEGMSVRAIADKFPKSYGTIYLLLRQKGVKLRPRIEAVNKALTTHSFNVNYFDVIDTEEKAYWLGFIMADGCVYNKGSTDYYTFSIGLKASDKHHLLKLKDALNSSHPISVDSRDLSRYVINSKKLCEALMKHGIVPRKSNKELVPPQMRNELLRHFWRGYFDGDGSLYITKNKTAKYGKSWGFNLLGSHTLLASFRDWMWSQRLLVKKPTLHRTRPNSKTFEIKMQSKSDVYNVTQAMYEGATVYLDRKMEKYLELKSSEGNDSQLKLPLRETSKT
jgi:predicted DNA-binding protein YlxM (UPF0122 family)